MINRKIEKYHTYILYKIICNSLFDRELDLNKERLHAQDLKKSVRRTSFKKSKIYQKRYVIPLYKELLRRVKSNAKIGKCALGIEIYSEDQIKAVRLFSRLHTGFEIEYHKNYIHIQW